MTVDPYHRPMADAEAVVYEAFRKHLGRLLSRHTGLLDSLDDKEAEALGRRGADAALAPLVWGEAVGDRWDTTEAAEFLGVTRQALHERVKRGTLLGVPGRGVTWFPTWQFDLVRHQAHPVVAEVVQVFSHMDQPLQAVEVASWARQVRPELDGLTPAEWIAEDRAAEAVVAAARHSAALLAA